MKIIANNEEEALNALFEHGLKNKSDRKKMLLVLVGTIRLLLKNNKKMVRHLLKSLVNKDEHLKS